MARSHSTINVPGFGEVPIVALGTVDDSFGSGGFGSDDEEPIFLSPIQRRLRDRGGFFGFGGGSLGMLNSFSFGGPGTGLGGLRAMHAAGGGSAAAATGSSAAAANNSGSTAGNTSSGDTARGDAGVGAPEQQQQQRARPFGLMDLHNRVADLARSRVELLSRSPFSSHRGSPAGERAALPPASSDEDEDGQVGGDGDGSDDDADETDGDEDGGRSVDDLPDYGMENDDDDSDQEDEQEEEDDYSEYFDEEDLNDEDMNDMFGSETTEAAFEAAEARTGGGQNGSARSSDDAGERGQDPGAAARLGPRSASGGSGRSRSSAGVGLSEEEEPLLAAHRAAEGAASHPRPRVYPRGGAASDVTEDAASRRARSTAALSPVPPVTMASVTGDAAAPVESEAQPRGVPTSGSAAAPAAAEAGPGPASGGRRRGRGLAFAWAAAQFALSAVLAPLRILMLVSGLSSGAVAAVTRPPRLPVAQRAHVPVVARSSTARVEEEGAAVAAARVPAERGQLPQPLQQPLFHQNDGMRRGSSGPGLAAGAHTAGDQLAATGGAGPAAASAASQDAAAAEPSFAASTSMAPCAASAAGPSSPTPTPHGIAHRHEQQSPPPPPPQQQQLQGDDAASRRRPRAFYVRPQIHFRRARPVVVRPRQGGGAFGAAAAVAALAPQAQGPVAGSPMAHLEALDPARGSGSSPLPAPYRGPTEGLRNSGSEPLPEPAVVSAEPTSAVERDEEEAAGVCGGSGAAGSCGGSGGSSGGDAGGEQRDAWSAGKALALQETLKPGAAPAAQPRGTDASAPGSSTAHAAGLGEAGAAVWGEGCDPRRAAAAVVAAPQGTVAAAAAAPAAPAAAAQAGHIRSAAAQSRRLAWQGAAAGVSNAAGVPPVAGSAGRHSCDVGAEADEESVGSGGSEMDGSEMDGSGSDLGSRRLWRPRILDADLDRLLSRAGFRNPDPGELQVPGGSAAAARGGSRHQTPSPAPGLAGPSAAASAATAAADGAGAGAGAGAAARGSASRIAASWPTQRGLPRPFGCPRALLRAVTPAGCMERPASHRLRRQSDHPPQAANSALPGAAPPGAAARVGGSGAGALGDAFNSGDAVAAMVATPVGAPLILRGSRCQVPEASERLQRLLLRRAASMENLRTATSRPPPPPLGGADVDALLAAPPRSTGSPAAAASSGGGATMRAPTMASFEPRLLRLPDTELGVAALNMLSVAAAAAAVGPTAAAAAGPTATVGASCGRSGSVRGSRAPAAAALVAAAAAAFAAAGSPDSGPWVGTASEEEQQRRMRAALAVPGQPPAAGATALQPAARPEDGDGSGAGSADGGHGARGRSCRGLDDGRWARSRLHLLGGSGLLGCSQRRPQRRPRRLAGAPGAWEDDAEGDGGTDSLDGHGGVWRYYYSDDGNTDRRALVAQTRPRAGTRLVDTLHLPRLDLSSRGGDRLGRWGPAAGGSGAGAGSDGVRDSRALNLEAARGLASPRRRLRIAWGYSWVDRNRAGQEGEQGGGETGPGSGDHHSVVEGSRAVAAAARAVEGAGGGSPLAPAPQLEFGTLAASTALGGPGAASVHFTGVPCQDFSLDDESELEEIAARLSPPVVASAARLGAAALAGGASEQAAPAAAAAGPTAAGGGGGGGGADRPLSAPPLQPRSLESDGVFADASDPESWAQGPPALDSEGESQEAAAASRLDLTSARRWLRQRCVGTPASAAPEAGGGGGDGVRSDGVAAAAAGTPAAAAAWTARIPDGASTSASSVEEQQLTSESGDTVWGLAEAGAGIIRAPAEGAGSRLSWPTGEADGCWSDGGDSEASSDWWAAAQPALRSSSGPVSDMAAGGAARPAAAAAESRAARFTDEESDDWSADEPRCVACTDGGDLQLPRWSSDDGYHDYDGEEAGRATVDGGGSLDDGRHDSDDWRPLPFIDDDEDEGDGTGGGGGGGGGQGAGEEEEASEDGSGGLLPLLLDECSDAEGEEEGVGGANRGDEARSDDVRFSGDADTYVMEYDDYLAGLCDSASADERLDERQAASVAPGGGGWRFHARADPRVSQTDSDDGMPPLFDADSDASSAPRPVPQSRTAAGWLRIADPADAAADVFASPSSRLPLRQQQPRRPSSSALTVGSVTSDLSFGRGGSVSDVPHDGGLGGGAGSFSVLRRAARAHGGGGSGLGDFLDGGGGGGGDNDSDDASSDDSMPPLVGLDSPIAGRPRAGGHRNRYDSPPPLLGSDSDTEPGLLRRPAWRAFARRQEASAASAAAQGHRDPAAAAAGAAAGPGPRAPSAQSSLSGNPGTSWRAAVEALLQALLDVRAVTGSRGRGGAGGVSQAAAALGSTMGAQMPAGAGNGTRGSLRPHGAASGGAGAGGTSQIVASVVSISANVLGSVAPGSLLGIAIPAGALSGGGGGASGGGGGGAGGGRAGGFSTSLGSSANGVVRLPMLSMSWRSYLPPEDSANGRHPNDQRHLPGSYEEDDIPAWAARFAPRLPPPPSPPRGPAASRQTSAAAATAGPPGEVGAAAGTQRRGPAGGHASDALAGWQALWEDFSSVTSGEMGRGEMDGNGEEEQQQQEQLREGEEDGSSVDGGVDLDADDTSGGDGGGDNLYDDAESLQDSLPELVPLEYESSGDEGDGGPGTSTAAATPPPPPPPPLMHEDEVLAAVAAAAAGEEVEDGGCGGGGIGRHAGRSGCADEAGSARWSSPDGDDDSFTINEDDDGSDDGDEDEEDGDDDAPQLMPSNDGDDVALPLFLYGDMGEVESEDDAEEDFADILHDLFLPEALPASTTAAATATAATVAAPPATVGSGEGVLAPAGGNGAPSLRPLTQREWEVEAEMGLDTEAAVSSAPGWSGCAGPAGGRSAAAAAAIAAATADGGGGDDAAPPPPMQIERGPPRADHLRHSAAAHMPHELQRAPDVGTRGGRQFAAAAYGAGEDAGASAGGAASGSIAAALADGHSGDEGEEAAAEEEEDIPPLLRGLVQLPPLPPPQQQQQQQQQQLLPQNPLQPALRPHHSAGPILVATSAGGPQPGPQGRTARGASASGLLPLPPMPAGAGAAPPSPSPPPRGPNTISRYAGPSAGDSDAEPGEAARGAAAAPAAAANAVANAGGGAGAGAGAGARAPGAVLARRNAVAYPRSVLLGMLEALRNAEAAMNSALHGSGRGSPAPGAAPAPAAAAAHDDGLEAWPPEGPTRPSSHIAAAGALLCDGAFVGRLLAGLPGVANEPPAFCVAETVRVLSLTGVEAGVRA